MRTLLGSGRLDEKTRYEDVSMNITDIETIVRILSQSDIAELELEQEGTRLHLVRRSGGQVVVQTGTQEHAVSYAPAPTGAPTTGARKDEIPDSYVKVQSPIVGTFYRRPSPDSEPFAKEGDRVKKDDTLCIVEAMKLMNEIPAPCSGKIEKVCLTDGQVVEFGEVLFIINPEG